MGFKFSAQFDQMDCGPACLKMVSNYFGKDYPIQFLRENSFLTKEGVSLLGLSNSAAKIGIDTFVAKIKVEKLTDSPLPCILYWNQNHFIVLYNIKKRNGKKIYQIADPGFGLINLSEQDFLASWSFDKGSGIALFLKPGPQFGKVESTINTNSSFKDLLKYLLPFKKELVKLFFSLGVGSLLTMVFPFITKILIDYGVDKKNLSLIVVLLLSQFFLYVGVSTTGIIRNWIALYIGSKVNIYIISDFLTKLMSLPLKFFDTKLKGDFLQRISDHDRIESFLTHEGIFTLFSLINVSVFLIVLTLYSVQILVVFIILTILSILWAYRFQHKKKQLDYVLFQQNSQNKENIYELINSVAEIKNNNFEDYKKNEWQVIQIKLFKIKQKILRLDQYQTIGFNLLNQIKNLIILYIASKEVLEGHITSGTLLSISFIIGEMGSPINQIISFIRTFQDAKISFERLSEINSIQSEKFGGLIAIPDANLISGFTIKDLSFQYEGPESSFAVEKINVCIPENRTTAIVGESGSGKTTLMKILLRFYTEYSVNILYNNCDLRQISLTEWRKNIGTVLQDGYIFSDTIERNIATSDLAIDKDKLNRAIEMARLSSYIESLPLRTKTKIGASGKGLSGGKNREFL
ncbi:ATP-binding cassette, subfamily B [Pedobacter terrae]|uniref:ATP-binding cassette, subfamily B n=1 Tax=Pedobacter terrae TaxID=405671 RepID=A0A1G8CMN6_9SPHI|nr:cysteine peptidase family C39 domain-containing protein [Pedobacter terrae]SDH46553.1 ATP-binding cassette, subfamily B [Pedobacter terrae]